MGTHPIFESDFDCLTVLKKMSSAEAEISTVAGHPKAQTVGGMRVVGKTPHETKPTVTEPDEGATGGAVQTQKSDQLIIAGAPVDEKKRLPHRSSQTHATETFANKGAETCAAKLAAEPQHSPTAIK